MDVTANQTAAPAQKEEAPVVEFALLPWQVEARECLEEFPYLICECGIWTGKTTWAAATVLEDMFQHPGETFWWCAPEDWHIRRFWEEFRPAAEHLNVYCRESPHCYAETPNGAKLYGVTMKNLKAISAYHPHAIYADEVAKMTEAALNLLWLRMLKCRRVVLVSSPASGRWEKIRALGKEHAHGKWALVTCTTAAAGIVTLEEIEIVRAEIPLALAAQDLDCKISEGPGAVFKAVIRVALLKPEDPIEGEVYVVTYDPADRNDYGAATAWRGFRQVYSERWRETGYRYQANKVVELAERFNMADIILDANGAGTPVAEMIDEEIRDLRVRVEKELRANASSERPVVPYLTEVRWDNALKGNLVNEATIMFERGHIQLIDPDEDPVYRIFLDEHKAFERRRSASGLTYTFEAPPGKHDDFVSTTLLRVHGASGPRMSILTPRKKGEDPRASKSRETGGGPGLTIIRPRS
jgi:hypothetical protein